MRTGIHSQTLLVHWIEEDLVENHFEQNIYTDY